MKHDHSVEILSGLVIQFVGTAMASLPETAAEQLIDEGELIRHAERDKCRHAMEQVARMSYQKKALALLALEGARNHPATMFKAIMDGWSATKIRFELNKLRGKTGRGENK